MNKYIKCETCNCWHTREEDHRCPEWLIARKASQEAIDELVKDIKEGKVKSEEIPF